MPAEAGCDRTGQLMQIALATVGELATLPRQMRHSFQPTARSSPGSRELALSFANPSGRLGAEPRIRNGSPVDNVTSLSTPQSIPTRLPAFWRTVCTSATSI